MKKIITILVMFVFSISTKAQVTPVKQGITGSGTVGFIPKFIGTKVLGNSVIYQSGNNIGIDVLNPSLKLELKSSTNGDFDGQRIYSNNGSHSLTMGWGGLESSYYLKLKCAIGQQIELIGNTHISGNLAINYPSGIVGTKMYVNGGLSSLNTYALRVDGESDGILNLYNNGSVTFGGLYSSRFSVRNDGNVAINLPTGSVNGTKLYLNGGSSTDNTYCMRLDGDVYDMFTVKNNGNVGIGTNSPTEKLHVNGNININDNATIGKNGSFPYFWFNKSTKTNDNYSIAHNSDFLILNANVDMPILFRRNNVSASGNVPLIDLVIS